MADTSLGSYVTSAVLFGTGVLTGVILGRISSAFSSNGISKVMSLRNTRLAALRAVMLQGSHKMVFAVRADLGMSKGKIGAQCGHAAVLCYKKALVDDIDNLDKWEARSCAKICVKVDSDEALLALENKANELKIVSAIVRDAGRTQVAPGAMTVIGIGPGPIEEIDKITGHLHLL